MANTTQQSTTVYTRSAPGTPAASGGTDDIYDKPGEHWGKFQEYTFSYVGANGLPKLEVKVTVTDKVYKSRTEFYPATNWFRLLWLGDLAEKYAANFEQLKVGDKLHWFGCAKVETYKATEEVYNAESGVFEMQEKEVVRKTPFYKSPRVDWTASGFAPDVNYSAAAQPRPVSLGSARPAPAMPTLPSVAGRGVIEDDDL